MPIRWLLGPQGQRVEFDVAPVWFEDRGIMPSWAVAAIIEGHRDEKPAFNVRPSDVNPKFTCRRQRVWQSNHDYGVSPLAEEAMVEGSALHAAFGAQEVEVPGPPQVAADAMSLIEEGISFIQPRLEVVGVPMRGRIDWLFGDRIDDLKTSTPFYIPKFPSKEAKAADPSLRPYADIWLPKSDDDDIKSYKTQLSIYRVLLLKSGHTPVPTKGRIWKRWSGVKHDKAKRWTRYDFDLWDEAELEAEVGPWVRGLAAWLERAKNSSEAWRTAEPDGLTMIGSRGNYFACERCPLYEACRAESKLEAF